jgi:hypothetical protein
MRIATAILCDFAEVRESLLFVLGGGVKRVWGRVLPAPMACCLGVLVEVDASQLTLPHELRADLTGPAGETCAQVRGGFQLNPNLILERDEAAIVPLALDLRNVGLPSYGWYTLALSLDDQPEPDTTFKLATPPQATVPGEHARRPH